MSAPFDPVAITGITRSGSTATATVASTADMYTGMMVFVYGADQEAYNGSFIITVASGTTFTYTVSGTPTTPATGTILFRKASNPYVPTNGAPYDPPPTSYHSEQLEDSAILKDSSGCLVSFFGVNAASEIRYIMVFDAVAVPANGTKPKMFVACGGPDNFFIDIPEDGERFTTGIVAAASTTAASLTVATDDQTHFDAKFHD